MAFGEIRKKLGFTMVELLTVMLLIAIMGSIAIPSFLDFKKDANIAVLQQNLAAMRVGMKNQIQQVILRCGARVEGGRMYSRAGLASAGGYSILTGPFINNDITTFATLCTPSEVPEVAERKFFNVSEGNKASFYLSGVEQVNVFKPMPKNPLAVPGPLYDLSGIITVIGGIAAYGGTCGYIDFLDSLNLHFNWVLDFPVAGGAEIFPGTRTPGVDECNF